MTFFSLKIVSSPSMNIKIHKVLSVGMSIYILLLAFGIYFRAQYTHETRVSQQEIIKLLLAEGDAEENQQGTSKSKKSFNPRPVIEDDDDSAKDLLSEIYFTAFHFDFPTSTSSASYLPHQLDTTTPPPWC
jgi:hypothetical protein